MPTWPSDLPCRPIAGTLQVTIEPNISEFKPDVGRAQRSRRYTLSRLPYSYEIGVTNEQLRLLRDGFFDVECAAGTKSFTMRDPADLSVTPATKTFTWASAPAFAQVAPNLYRAQISLSRED